MIAQESEPYRPRQRKPDGRDRDRQTDPDADPQTQQITQPFSGKVTNSLNASV